MCFGGGNSNSSKSSKVFYIKSFYRFKTGDVFIKALVVYIAVSNRNDFQKMMHNKYPT